MKKTQFKELENFSYFNDFSSTKGNLRKMKFEVFEKAQALRDILPQRNNSQNFLKILSTNAPRSNNSKHNSGEAIDVFCPLANGLSINSFVEKALQVGFRGIGVYINESGVPSFHLDIREEFQLWFGGKDQSVDSWKYSDLIEFENV